MKHSILVIALNLLLAGLLITSCDNRKDNVRDAEEDVTQQQQELNEAEQDLDSEIQEFRAETQQEIRENENEIADLKAELETQGEEANEEQREKIAELEQRNEELKNDLNTYDPNNTTRQDWEEFKRDFNREMDELGDEIANFFDADNDGDVSSNN